MKNIFLILLIVLFAAYAYAEEVKKNAPYVRTNKSTRATECVDADGNLLLSSITIKGNIKETPCKNGKAEGIEKWYYEDGKIWIEIPHKEGQIDGLMRSYYQSGKISIETPYRAGKREGVEMEYSESGKLIRETLYKNDWQKKETIY